MYETEIRTGMDVLDNITPGWEKNIDRDRLNIARGCDCIGGQLFGTFGLFVNKLRAFGYSKSLEDMGFIAPPSCMSVEYDNVSEILTEEWRTAIEARLSLDSELAEGGYEQVLA